MRFAASVRSGTCCLAWCSCMQIAWSMYAMQHANCSPPRKRGKTVCSTTCVAEAGERPCFRHQPSLCSQPDT